MQVKWGDDQDLFMARVTGRRISVTYQVSTSFHLLLYVGKKGVKFRQVRPETIEVVTELFFFYYLYWLSSKSERTQSTMLL